MSSSSVPSKPKARRSRGIWLWVVVALAVLLVLMQFVRFVVPDLALDNPPVTQTVAWDSAETRQLFGQACADCHSNETVYPWYSYVAPVGWLVAYDVHEGRSKYNISQDQRGEGDEMADEIREGGMPLPIYVRMHPEARLTEEQKQTLIRGVEATFGGEESGASRGDDEGDGD